MRKKISSNKTTTKKIANSNTSYVHTLKIFFFCSCCCCWEMCTKKFYRWTKVYRWIWNYITNSMRIFFFASLLFVFCMFLMMIITGKPEKNSRWISRIEKFICIHPLDFHMITCVCVCVEILFNIIYFVCLWIFPNTHIQDQIDPSLVNILVQLVAEKIQQCFADFNETRNKQLWTVNRIHFFLFFHHHSVRFLSASIPLFLFAQF